MKILRVLSSVNPKGGGVIEGVKQLQAPLAALGVFSEIACCDAPGESWLAMADLPKTYALGPSRWGYRYTSQLYPWLCENRKSYDAIVVEGLWQYHSFAVWRALQGTDTPYFVFSHGMLDPWFKYNYPLKHIKKWLYWPWAEYRVLRDARTVLFTCEEERRLARRSFWLYNIREAVTGYGTFGPPLQSKKLADSFLRIYPALKNKRVILFLSRIHEKKGCDLLLQAFSRVADSDGSLHLVIAGPDQTGWLIKLKKAAAHYGIAERVTWPGMLVGDLKWGAFFAAEAFALPSHQENFGIVVAEALGCGKPVLISNKVNIWREIEADGAGLVDDDTLAGTTQNFKRYLSQTESEYLLMCRRARECFKKRYHIQQVAKRLLNVIEASIV